MSNEEKETRELYINKRRKRIRIQIIVLIVVSLFSILSFAVYNNLSKTFYINYT